MKKRLTIAASVRPAITITRQAIKRRRFVYIAQANRRIKYPHGRSAVVYIGTTKVGAGRMAVSAAVKARQILEQRGMKELRFFVVSSKRRPGLKSWSRLEVALILKFKELYGAVPLGNTVGKRQHWGNELRYFTGRRLEAVLRRFEA